LSNGSHERKEEGCENERKEIMYRVKKAKKKMRKKIREDEYEEKEDVG
jgi:hypothetical protein